MATEPEFSAKVLWESNGAVIECYLWDKPQSDFEDDLLELSIKPGPGLGEPHNLLMDLNDAWALVSVISQCALKLQTKMTEEKEILDAPKTQNKT